MASEQAEDVTQHASLHRCTRCGACDAQLAVEDPWDYALVGPPSIWVRTLAKSHARWPELAGVLACAPKSSVRAMEQRCPVDVPFIALREQAMIDRPKPAPKKARKREDPG